MSQAVEMGVSPSPAESLSPEAFYSLYLGGLAQEDEQDRLETCYTLLLVGRLGMRPGEVLHLHDGWVNWDRGEIHVPARDPCACRACWQQAQMRQQQGDSRMLAEIVAEERWSPAGTARRLSFGWADRLTAALDGVLAERGYLPGTHEDIEELIDTAAANAHGIDERAVSVTALRSSALEFLAAAGFGPRRLADLCGVDEQTAGEFARIGGGQSRDHLYRVLGEGEPPALCGEESEYQIVCGAPAFDREPFDPAAYDRAWRQARESESGRPDRNPRPVSAPPHVSFDPDEAFALSEPAGDSGPGIVAESLREWVTARERPPDTPADPVERVTDTEAAGSEASTTDESGSQTRDTARRDEEQETDDDPLSKVTEPVEFSVDTRFVAADFESGRPTGGSVILGQEELVFLSRDETGISGLLRVSLDWIVNVVPGYVPEPLEGLFEDTVGLAYEKDERQVIVTEIPSKHRWSFTRTLFGYVLDETSAVVTHRPDWDASAGPERRTIEIEPQRLRFHPTDDQGGRITIRLDMLVDVTEGKLTGEEGYELGLVLHYLRTNGQLTRTEVRPTSERSTELLKRFLLQYKKRQNRQIRNAPLTVEADSALESLYENSGGANIDSMLQRDEEEINEVMEMLVENNLVVDTTDGRRLTGAGYRLVSDEFEVGSG